MVKRYRGRVVLSILIFIYSTSVYCQQNLLDSLFSELKLGCVDTSQLIVPQDFCDIAERKLECAIDLEKLFDIFREIQDTKNPELIVPLLKLENAYFEYLKPIWKLYDMEYVGMNCSYLRSHYDIGVAFEVTLKALKFIKHNNTPKEIYNEFIKSREYWSGGLRTDSLFMEHPFFKVNYGASFGRKYNIDFIYPFLDLLENEMVKDLKNLIPHLDYYNMRDYYKWSLTKHLIVKMNSPKIRKVIKAYESDLMWEVHIIKPALNLLISEVTNPNDIKYIIDALYTNVNLMYYRDKRGDKWTTPGFHEKVILFNFINIFSSKDVLFYNDRSKNESPARNYLEQKMLNEAKNTKNLHKTSKVLGGYYHDERMLKLLLKIEKIITSIEDKKTMLNLFEPYKVLSEKYGRSIRKELVRTIKRIEKLK